jgi:protein-disulfide isomerase
MCVLLYRRLHDEYGTALLAQQFVQQYGITYTPVLDDNQRVATLYNLNATPTSYFIDRQGIIRSTVVGPVDDTTLQLARLASHHSHESGTNAGFRLCRISQQTRC